jgi:hypothetical protein
MYDMPYTNYLWKFFIWRFKYKIIYF